MACILLAAALVQSAAVDADAETAASIRAIYESLERQKSVEKPVERRKRIVMATAPWCGVCTRGLNEFQAWLEKSGWVFGESPTCHVQLVDVDKHPAFVQRYRITSLPTFILMEDGKEIRRSGYVGKNTIPKLWGLQ